MEWGRHMRIAAFADLHAHLYKEFDVRTELTGSSRLDKQVSTIKYIRDHCVIEGINLVLFAGDLFHARGGVNTKVKNAIYDEIKAFSKADITIVIIAGNHDQYDNSDVPQNSLHELKQLKGVYVYDTVCKHPIYVPHPGIKVQKPGDIIELVCAPYSKNVQLVKDYIASVEKRDIPQILLFHLGVDGGFVGKGSYPMADAFDVEDLRPDVFKYVIGGHFHRSQTLGGHPHVMYLGAPIQHSFSDEGEDKGFYIFGMEKDCDIEFVPIPNPKFITVDGVPDKFSADDLRLAVSQGDYIRFLVTEEELILWEDIIPLGLQYKVELKREYEEQTRIPIKVGMSFEEIIRLYAEENMPEAMQVGLSILAEVQQK